MLLLSIGSFEKIKMGNKEVCSLYATIPFLSLGQRIANFKADSVLNRPNCLL